jgi:hypothetical protein
MRNRLSPVQSTGMGLALFTGIILLGMETANAMPPQLQLLQQPRPTGQPARRSLSELRSVILGMHAKIQSLVVEMDSSNSERFDDEVVRSVAVAKGSSRRYSRHHLADPIEEDPSSYVQILDGGFDVYYPYNRGFEKAKVQVRPEHTIKIHATTPFEILAWWPPSDTTARPKIGGRSFFLKDVLEDPRCTVRPSQEQIAGRWSHVVEIPGLEALWIDDEASVLLRRECRATEEDSPIVYEFGDFEDFGDGIILPRKITRRRSPPFQPATFHRVVKYEINSVEDRYFAVDLPPGTMVIDRDTDTWRQIPGGIEFLETICSRCRSLAAGPRAGWSFPLSRLWVPASLFLIGLAGPPALGLIGRLRPRSHGRGRAGVVGVGSASSGAVA